MSDFRLKYTKIVFGWGSAPDPAGGAYSARPDPLAGLKGPTSKGRGGDMGKEGKGRKGRGRQGRGGEGEGGHPLIFYCTPQFQFSRNMPGTTDAATIIIHVHHLSSA